GMESVADNLKIAALASGVDALRGALDAAVKQGLAPVAIGAIGVLADGGEAIDQIGQSSLLGALRSSDKRITYAAAAASVAASRGSNVPSLSSVVDVLAQAVTEERINTIHMIMPDAGAKAVAEIANAERGRSFIVDSNARAGTLTLLNNPSVDVVVINEILPDGLPEDVIGNVRKDSRMANAKIVIVT